MGGSRTVKSQEVARSWGQQDDGKSWRSRRHLLRLLRAAVAKMRLSDLRPRQLLSGLRQNDSKQPNKDLSHVSDTRQGRDENF